PSPRSPPPASSSSCAAPPSSPRSRTAWCSRSDPPSSASAPPSSPASVAPGSPPSADARPHPGWGCATAPSPRPRRERLAPLPHSPAALHCAEYPRIAAGGRPVHDQPCERTTLDNGLRILTSCMPATRSVAISIYVGAGSRYETPELSGVSHLLEHLLFKGTHKRPSPQAISEAIDGVGGVLNAGTDRELTVYYAKVAAPHFGLAAD